MGLSATRREWLRVLWWLATIAVGVAAWVCLSFLAWNTNELRKGDGCYWWEGHETDADGWYTSYIGQTDFRWLPPRVECTQVTYETGAALVEWHGYTGIYLFALVPPAVFTGSVVALRKTRPTTPSSSDAQLMPFGA